MFDWLEKELAETQNLEEQVEILKEELSNQIKRAEGWREHTFKYERGMKEILKVETDSWEEDLRGIRSIAKKCLGKRLT